MRFVNKVLYFLIPSSFQGVLSFVMLPITTYILNPEDYGVYVLFTSFTALGSIITTSSATYLLSGYYPEIDKVERGRLISSILLVGLGLGSIFSLVVIVFWPLITELGPFFSAAPRTAAILALTSMLFSIPWAIAYLVIILEGSARIFAWTTISSSIASAVTVTIALYVFDQKGMALFEAGIASSIILMIGSLIVIKPHVNFFSVSRKWLRRILKVGFLATSSNVLETFQNIFEKALLSSHVGFVQLGLYAHAQLYKNASFMPVKALNNSVWATTLEESRDAGSNFPKTRQVQGLTQVGIVLLGLFFATIGEYLIDLLTHGKFTAASFFVTFLMILLLVQSTGKAESGILYTHEKGKSIINLMMVSTFVSIVIMYFIIPRFGVMGAISSILAQQLLFRIGIQWCAKKYRRVPFQDSWALFGTISILGLLYVSESVHLNFVESAALCLTSQLIVIFLATNIIKSAFLKVYAVMRTS